MILAWLSHGVTLIAQELTLISEREKYNRFTPRFGGGEAKRGRIRTEGLGMLVGVWELAKATTPARIAHRSPLHLRPRLRRLVRDTAEEGIYLVLYLPTDFVMNGVRASDDTRLPEVPGDLESEPTC